MTNQPTLRQKLLSKPIVIIAILSVLSVAAIVAWKHHAADKVESSKEEAKRARIPLVKIEKASRKDVPVYLEGLGTVQASSTVVVHSQIQGQLMEVLFREGQDVQKGDVLAKIDPRSYQAQLEQALATKAKDKALLENAKRDLARYVQLGTMIAQQTIDTQRSSVAQLQAALQSDEAAINNARTSLSYTVITAPIGGRTGLRQVDAGNIIQPATGNGLVVITQLEPISVLFSLPSSFLPSVNEAISKQGKLQVIAQDGASGKVLDTGVLDLVDNQIDQNTGTIRLKSTFPNASRLLWPGGFVNVKLLLEMRKSSLVVPIIAVQQGPNGSYLFVMAEDKTVKMRAVKLALSEKGDAVIESGLAEGEQVVTEGAASLEDGKKVKVSGKP